MWYDRFLVYVALGVIRSVNQAYKHWRVRYDPDVSDDDRAAIGNAPTHWYDAADKHNWLERATLYDDMLRAKWSDDDMLEQAKRERIALFDTIVKKTALELASREYTESPNNQVSSTMKTASRELHQELGDKSSVKFNVVLDKLPAKLQETLAKALDQD